MKISTLHRLLAALLALALAGCFRDEKPAQVAGGDDIPNGVEPLGKKSAAARDDSTDWNGFRTIPKSSPGMYDTTGVPDAPPDTGHAAPKSGAGSRAPKASPKQSAAPRSAGLAKRSTMPGDSLPGSPAGTPPTPGTPTLPDTLAGSVPKPDTIGKPPLPDTALAGAPTPVDSLPSGPGLPPADPVPAPTDATGSTGTGAGTSTETSTATQTSGSAEADLPLPPIGPLPPLDSILKVDTVVTRVLDTVKGTVETVRTQVSETATRVDSTVFMPVDSSNPGAPRGLLQVSGKVSYADSLLWDAFKFADADGDGFLAPIAGSKNLADIELTSSLAGGVLSKSMKRIAAGADLNFNARGDNLLLISELLRTVAGDTIDLVRLLDADGDSVIIDFSKETNLVKVIELHVYASGAIASLTREVVVVAFSKDSTRNYPVRFTEKRVLRAGGTLELSASGEAPGSDFLPGKEAWWVETHVRADADTIQKRERSFRVKLAETPGAFGGNVLLAHSVSDTFRAGEVSDFAFDFRCATPVADKAWPKDGAVSARIFFRTLPRLEFQGEATAEGMSGLLMEPDGTQTNLSFDRSGKPRP